jgi:hypothetical protein
MKKSIKGDRNLLLTSLLLFFMLAAGITSGVLGFISGHEALKGVTQPDIRPNNSKGGNAQNLSTKGLELLQEKDLIANVKKQMGAEDPQRNTQQIKDANQQAKAFENAVANDPKVGLPIVKLPIVRADQGIEMAVKSIDSKSNNNNVRIAVTLVNRGSQAVNFAQSTINVTNDRSQGIGATTTGLPRSLLANGREAKMMLAIPKNALGNVKTVSLQLTDADKKLQLEIPGLIVK